MTPAALENLSGRLALAVLRHEASCAAALAGAFKAHPELTPADKACVREDVFQALCHDAEIRAAIAGERGSGERGRVSPREIILRAREIAGSGADPCRSLPPAFSAALQKEYGAEATALAGAFNTLPPRTQRANTLKISRDELLERLRAEGVSVRAGGLSVAALIVDGVQPQASELYATGAFREGLFETQDEGSQLLAELLAPPRGGRVLDLCAGAGGKTLALAALMNNGGALLALDIGKARIEELRRRARRAGAHNIRALSHAAGKLLPDVAALAGRFERVLVDAPCSGSGALRRNPESRTRLAEPPSEKLLATQRELLEQAWTLCAPGGRVMYATCSVLCAENETLAEFFVARSGAAVVAPREIFGKSRAEALETPCGRFLKLLPHRHNTDGFFAAVFRKPR